MPISGGLMVIYTIKNMYLELAKVLNPELDVEEKVKEDLNSW